MRAVVDTNVVLVANNAHQDVSPECVVACIDRLHDLMINGKVVIDDEWRVLEEYKNKTVPTKNKRPGDVFVLWLLKNRANVKHVEQVTLLEISKNKFSNFPDSDLQAEVDPPDRKFMAIAAAHPDRPPIWQAADSKWLDWWPRMADAGVTVEFLCKTDIRRFYRKKFPGKSSPSLP